MTEIIFRVLPLFAMLPTAYVISLALFNVLHWSIWIVVPAGLVVEGVGFVAVNLWKRMNSFNRTLHKSNDEQKLVAPTWQAGGVVFLYTVVSVALAVLLDVIPKLAIYAPAVFPFMGLAGDWLWSLEREQSERELERDELRSERAKAREKRRLERARAKKSDAQSRSERRRATLNLAQSEGERRLERPRATESDAQVKIYRCECGFQTTNRFEISGHKSQCAIHKELKNKPIPIDLSIAEEAVR